MSRLLKTITTALLVAVVSMQAVMAGQAEPNIVIIINDDMGYADIGCFGAPNIKTPRIDQMAKEGRRFTNFYMAASVCSPSRAALMTGSYPQRVGVEHVIFPDSGHGLDPSHLTLAELLKSAGYATLAAGKWHLGDQAKYLPTNQGFDSFYGIPYSNDMGPAKNMKYADDCTFREGLSLEKLAEAFSQHKGKGRVLGGKVPLMRDEECIEFPLDQTTITRRLTDEGISFIEKSVNEDKPFFLYLANPMPHTPLYVSPEFEGKSAGGKYGDVIEEIDFNTGRILDALKKNGVAENTLVIFTSDNGPWLVQKGRCGSAKPFRDGKGSTYEGGQRVPCVMRWPDMIPRGTESAELATAMDLLPTFSEMAGVALPPELKPDGHSMLKLMTGDPEGKTSYAAFYFGHRKNNSAVRVKNWKYRKGPRNGVWSGIKTKDNPSVEQLFDLAKDPGESTNLIKQYPEVAERLKIQLSQVPTIPKRR